MASTDVLTKAEEKTQVRACRCSDKISSLNTHLMCVMCLGLKYAQATFESSEECTHFSQSFFKLLCGRLAR